MGRLILAVFLTLLVIYVIPFAIYGGASAIAGLRPPSTASPARFLLGVLITKLGTAIAFVALFKVALSIWGDRWLGYAVLWFVMFALSEMGEMVSEPS